MMDRKTEDLLRRKLEREEARILTERRAGIGCAVVLLLIIGPIVYSCSQMEPSPPPRAITSTVEWRAASQADRFVQAGIWADTLKPGATSQEIAALKACIDEGAAGGVANIREIAAMCAISMGWR